MNATTNSSAAQKFPRPGVERAPGLRQQKIERQRQRLISIGIELFSKKGFEATSVTEIASAAELSEQTFYRYFKTKDELAFEFNEENGRQAMEILMARPREEPVMDSIRIALRSLIAKIEDKRLAWKKIIRLIYASPALEARCAYVGVRWSKAFTLALLRERSAGAEANFLLGVQVSLVMVAFNLATHFWGHSDDESLTLSDVVENAFSTLLYQKP